MYNVHPTKLAQLYSVHYVFFCNILYCDVLYDQGLPGLA